MRKILFLITFLLVGAPFAQKIGTRKANNPLPLPIKVNGATLATSSTIDANWRWYHIKNNYTPNCYGPNGWNTAVCPDPITCVNNCQLEGVPTADYTNVYRVTTSGNSQTIKYATYTASTNLTNVGARMYLLDPSGVKYYGFNLLNSEFRFTVDMSKVPCGINSALYFVSLPLDGGLNSLNQAGAAYGTGYGDAQGPTDLHFVNGFANTNGTGSFSPEFDVWESNANATQMTGHPCTFAVGTKKCMNSTDCGPDSYCDKAGADVNPFRLGQPDLYGPGKVVDTARPFTVITQFFTDTGTATGKLVRVHQQYLQDGKLTEGGDMTDALAAIRHAAFNESDRFNSLGGMAQLGLSLTNATLVTSLWGDSFARMQWLDGRYPFNSTGAGTLRGPCDPNGGDFDQTVKDYPNAQVIFSDIQLNSLSPSGAPTLAPSKAPVTPSPTTECSPQWGQCSGLRWTGPTCCQPGLTCVVQNEYYGQCLAGTPAPSSSAPTRAPTLAPTRPPTNAPLSPAPTRPPTRAPTSSPSTPSVCASNRYQCYQCTCLT